MPRLTPTPQDPLLPLSRNLYCPSYDLCLTQAVALQWAGFSCSSCPSRATLPPPGSLDLLLESSRCLELITAAFLPPTYGQGSKRYQAGLEAGAENPSDFRTIPDNLPAKWRRLLGIIG